MPIYAYKCQSCGLAKDVLQKISDPVLTDCPVCGKPAFTKQVTAAGFQLKGSGWYVTDFREGAKPKDSTAAPSDKATTESTTKTDNSSTETAAASATPSATPSATTKVESSTATPATLNPSLGASS